MSPIRTDTFDLGGLRLTSGEGRRLDLDVRIEPFSLAGEKYPVLLKVYGGPHARMVEDARDGYVMDQFYADAGFVVVRSDTGDRVGAPPETYAQMVDTVVAPAVAAG